MTGESTYDEPPAGEIAEASAEDGAFADQAGADVGGGWTQYEDETGAVYFYNNSTGESTYEVPEGVQAPDVPT